MSAKLLDLLKTVDDAAREWAGTKYLKGRAADGRDDLRWQQVRAYEEQAYLKYDEARRALRDAIRTEAQS